MKEKINKLNIYMLYTISFLVIISILVLIFVFNEKSFAWKIDGVHQHVITLYKFREILLNFFATGKISTFTWGVGSGMDLFSNFAYYIFGDIFSYFSILIPKNHIFDFYNVFVIVRWYFIGLSFILFCKYKKYSTFSTLIGTLTYTFSAFALTFIPRHPYFANPLILLPLLMIGTEKLIKEDKYLFFVIIVALMFISNFYFSYMISIVIAIYAIILIIHNYKNQGFKKILRKTCQIIFYSVLGLLISSVILFPTLISFLNSERAIPTQIYPYDITYYKTFLVSLIDMDSPGYAVFFGGYSILLLALPSFIKKRKENYPLFLWLMILLMPILFSKVSSILCGFGFPNNRWSYVFSFIFAVIITIFLNNNITLKKKDRIYPVILLSVIIISNFIFNISLRAYVLLQIIVFVILYIINLNKNKIESKYNKKIYEELIGFVMIACVLIGVIFRYSPNYNKYTSEFVDKDINKYLDNAGDNNISYFDKSIDYIKGKDKDFYNIIKISSLKDSKDLKDLKDKKVFNYNAGLYNGYNSINYYYSIKPALQKSLARDLIDREYDVSFVKNFDNRTKLLSLLGVKYVITEDENKVPYGFTLDKQIDNSNTKIYVNKYPISFASLYTSYINESDYDKMFPLEKEGSLLKSTVLEENNKYKNNLKYQINSSDIQKVSFKMLDINNIKTGKEIIIKNKKQNYIELEIDEIKNSELYVYIKGLNYEPDLSKHKVLDKIRYHFTIGVQNGIVSKTLEINDYKVSAYYTKHDEILFNMGYYEENSNKIKIQFSRVGKYSFDNIEVYAVSMNNHENEINNLNKSNFKLLSYENEKLTATVSPEQNGILQFQTYYDEGWNVYVDGKKVDSFKSNKYFLGIYIEKGEHEISLIYKNPYIPKWALISGISLIALIIITIKKTKYSTKKLDKTI